MIHSAAVVITNRSGLHARPAAELSKVVGSLSSTITIHAGDKTTNAASVLALMIARIQQGDRVTVTAEGIEAEADLAAVVAAIESGLGE